MQKYTDLDPNRFNVDGVGWDRPADPSDPDEPHQEPPRRDQGAHGRERRAERGVFRPRQRRPATRARAGWQVTRLEQSSAVTGETRRRRTEPRAPGQARPRRGWLERGAGLFLGLREQAPRWQVVLIGLLGVGACFGTLVVRHPGRARGADHLAVEGAVQPLGDVLELPQPLVRPGPDAQPADHPAPGVLGFGLATLVGVPLGVLCGCFSRVNAFFLPMTLFGRNIPVAALIPLTFSLFGIGELQKVMFIFIACVAFIVSDTARAIGEVREAVHRHGLHPGGGPLADDHQGAGAAGHAQHLQLAAAAVLAGLRLHHAGRGGQVRRRVGRAGRHHQHLATARARASTCCWCC